MFKQIWSGLEKREILQERKRIRLAEDDEHVNPSNTKLNPIRHLLALLGAHPILQVSRIKVNDVRRHRRVCIFIGTMEQ